MKTDDSNYSWLSHISDTVKRSTSTSTSSSYSQQSISDYYWEALSGTAMKMMKMGDVKA